MTKYDDLEFDKKTIDREIEKLINQIYKLLPMREEKKEWTSTLENLIVEIKGLNEIFIDQLMLLTILSKLEGLISLDKDCDFILFRKTIFDCLNLLTKLKNEWNR